MRDVFDETDFLPAKVSDRPIEENDTVFDTSGKEIGASATSTTDSFAPSTTGSSARSTFASSAPSTSASFAPLTSASSVPLTSASSTPSTSDSSTPSISASSAPSTSASSANNFSALLLSVEQINPLPKKSFQTVTKKRKTLKSTFFTGSPRKKFVLLNSAKTPATYAKKAPSNIGPRQKKGKKKQPPPKTFMFTPV